MRVLAGDGSRQSAGRETAVEKYTKHRGPCLVCLSCADVVVLYRLPYHVAQLLYCLLIARQRVALGVVEEVRRVWVADVVQRQRAVEVRIHGADCRPGQRGEHGTRLGAGKTY